MLESNSASGWSALRNDPAFRRTFGYFAIFIILGLDLGLGGPTLPALANQTHTRVGTMGWMFLLSSIGYAIGTTWGGRIFDRMRGHLVIGTAQLCAALLIAFIPIIPWFWLLMALVIVKGIASGLINTGANTLLMWTHGEKASPFVNALHFFFGLGAFLSPFLVAQVINIEGGYRFAYWILTVLAVLVGLRILTMPGDPEPHRHEATADSATTRIPYAFVITAALFLFFYVGAEVTFGGWVYTYAVTLSLATAAGAAYLNSAFWLSFTVGRLVSIPMAMRFKPVQVIPVALAGCLIILGVGILYSGSSTLIWVTAIGLGFCMAPVWPSGYTLAGQSLKLTARASSIILLGDGFGGMVLPWLVGQVINLSGPQAMVYMVFGSLIFNLIAYVVLLQLRARQLQVA